MIEWLMQTTADGSTYLQVIILSVLLFGAVIVRVKTWNEIVQSLKEGDCDD